MLRARLLPVVQTPVLKAKFHSAKTNKSTMLWAWIHTWVVMDICPLAHAEVWPCWRKYVTRVGLWEFKSSSHFQFVLSVFCCGSGCERSASGSCGHACCLPLAATLPTVTDSHPSGTVSQRKASLSRLPWCCITTERQPIRSLTIQKKGQEGVGR